MDAAYGELWRSLDFNENKLFN